MSDLYPEVVETERLRLVARLPEYLDFYEVYDRCSAPEIDDVTRFMPWSRHETPKVTKEFLDRGESAWNDAESADYAVYTRESEDGGGQLAGFGGIHTKWDRRVGQLGLWIRPQFWGRGYSGERAAALVALGFDVLDLEVVEVSHVAANEKSQRAIEKYMGALGGRLDGRDRNSIIVDGDPVDELRYSVSRDEWQETTGGEYDAEFYWDASDIL
ncbi:GNAT family N-acetyltransferase [Haloferax profundi]|uniref:GCN5 family acetyltransferase n=1 Tax=Haloferax profundi TaxID=1544718 RepID=A0A0W1SQF4_9EURY|nr:GNAT family protein [Haloferax profundi]KTG28341.1 GCN5 family acetyltransferase [Haloferax profundi]